MDGRPITFLQIPRNAWSRWFAGSEPPAEPWSWPPFLVLGLVAGLLLLSRLSLPLLEPEETRYAEIPRQMLAEGRFVEPVWHGEPYYHKPPLFYWLVMLSYQVFGVSDGAARLVPALSTLALVGVVYAWSWRVLSLRTALVTGLLLCLSGRFLFLGRMVILDGLLALWVTAGLACAHLALRSGQLRWGWWLLAGIACGLGVLTKGPVAIVLVFAPALLFSWLDARAGRITWRAGLTFLTVTMLIAGPWFAALAFSSPEAFWAFFLQHNVERFVQPFDHSRPAWFFIPGLLLGLFPASLLLVPVFRVVVSTRREWSDHRSEALGFFLLALICGFGLFSLSGCKRPVYLLPCLPLFALVLTAGFSAIAPATRAGAMRWISFAAALFLLLLVGVQEWLPNYHRAFGMRGQVRRHCDGEALPVLCYPHRWDSVSFYLQRADVGAFSSGERDALLAQLQKNETTLVFVKNEKHLAEFRDLLPASLEFVPKGRSGRNVTAGWVLRSDSTQRQATARVNAKLSAP